MVPQLISIEIVIPKWSPMKDVVEFLYIEAYVFHEGQQPCMINEAEGVSELYVCDVYIFVCKSCFFKGCYNHLDLHGALWPETFLAKV